MSQDREIMRVLVECCLQERVFNKYYVALASKLCEHDKNHKFTLQVPFLSLVMYKLSRLLETGVHMVRVIGS